VASAKGPVERKVVRVVTPGTLTDLELLNDKTEAILLSLQQGPRNQCGLAWLSLTQGVVQLAECAIDDLAGWVQRIGAGELIFSAGATPGFEARLRALQTNAPCSLVTRPEWQFDAALGQRTLLAHLQAASLAAWQAQDLSLGQAAAAAHAGLR
jgi:DNA mismatch repair protein MutS